MKKYWVLLIFFILACLSIKFDKPASDWLHWTLQPWDFWLQKITWLGDGKFLTPVLLVSTFILWWFRKTWKDLWWIPLTTTLSYLVSTGCVNGMKRIMGRPRPYLEWDFRFTNLDFTTFYWLSMHSEYHSFPSGHAAAIFSVAWFLVRAYKQKKIQGLVLSIAVLVALSRVALAKHFFADVVAGAVVGIFFSELAFTFFLKIKIKKNHSIQQKF